MHVSAVESSSLGTFAESLFASQGHGPAGAAGHLQFRGFWGVGVVCGYYLAFHVGWGLQGLWTGILMGVVITGCDHCTWEQSRVVAFASPDAPLFCLPCFQV